MRRTKDYYDENAALLFERYNSADMTGNYNRFIRYLIAGCSIIDIGCGSGRDMKYFSSKGFEVRGIDYSPTLSKLAEKYSGCRVDCVDFLSWQADHAYDAFWANASLLHLTEEELSLFFQTKLQYLRAGGVFYLSMKTGIETGLDEKGRFFQSFDERLLDALLIDNPCLSVLDKWISEDGLGRDSLKWFCVILRKNQLV